MNHFVQLLFAGGYRVLPVHEFCSMQMLFNRSSNSQVYYSIIEMERDNEKRKTKKQNQHWNYRKLSKIIESQRALHMKQSKALWRWLRPRLCVYICTYIIFGWLCVCVWLSSSRIEIIKSKDCVKGRRLINFKFVLYIFNQFSLDSDAITIFYWPKTRKFPTIFPFQLVFFLFFIHSFVFVWSVVWDNLGLSSSLSIIIFLILFTNWTTMETQNNVNGHKKIGIHFYRLEKFEEEILVRNVVELISMKLYFDGRHCKIV